ncbi:carbonic anhydrase [Methanogenium marinum]|uniref:carbonic anhydrase n=1 Tax=Methanogenium marinum TaxID=348610 RepID=A0A9Q4PVG3_9EURY|nr:carbonic anhydrase [Methanogenium marinum]MDE4907539.1 carbonic anhydrase [Methanogenium marinum]
MVERFIEGNRAFIENDFRKDNEHYQKLATSQSPESLWIACSDSRVNPERIVNAKMGDIFVHRNIGNIVAKDDPNLGCVLEYAVGHLKVKYIIICGHSDCGAMKALDADMSEEEYIPVWLENAQEVKETIEEEHGTPAECANLAARKKGIEMENIKVQLENLRSYSPVKCAEDEGRVQLHGLFYDLGTGKLEQIV